jgi:hypothetical protein
MDTHDKSRLINFRNFRKKRLSGCFDELEIKIVKKVCIDESQRSSSGASFCSFNSFKEYQKKRYY